MSLEKEETVFVDFVEDFVDFSFLLLLFCC